MSHAEKDCQSGCYSKNALFQPIAPDSATPSLEHSDFYGENRQHLFFIALSQAVSEAGADCCAGKLDFQQSIQHANIIYLK